MEAQQLLPNIFRVPFAVGQVYAWVRDGGLTLVDTGLPGAAEAIVTALTTIGHELGEVTDIVITHGHRDHRGGAAALVRASGTRVIAGALEVEVLRGDRPEPTPRLADRDRDLLARVMAQLPQTDVEPVDVDQRVCHGVAVLCAGYGDPVVGNAAQALRALPATL